MKLYNNKVQPTLSITKESANKGKDGAPPVSPSLMQKWIDLSRVMSEGYYERQRPDYQSRPSDDTIPQKASPSNPRHRTRFHRNR